MQRIASFLIIIFFQSYSLASDCKAVKWPFSKNIKDVQPLSFQSIPRNHLYKYLYFEISNPTTIRVKGLASNLFFFLKNSEQNEDRYQMLQALEWAADLQTQTPRIIPISEICSMEDKINREPSSTKQEMLQNPKKKK
ncbi:MAG: hypothetical protein ACK4VO_14045 [Pseudobdellovibrio sp.]